MLFLRLRLMQEDLHKKDSFSRNQTPLLESQLLKFRPTSDLVLSPNSNRETLDWLLTQVGIALLTLQRSTLKFHTIWKLVVKLKLSTLRVRRTLLQLQTLHTIDCCLLQVSVVLKHSLLVSILILELSRTIRQQETLHFHTLSVRSLAMSLLFTELLRLKNISKTNKMVFITSQF